jgi:nitrile hydratase accessory protein
MDKVGKENMILEGTAAPPMANGELVFESPWEGRVFGMARALCEANLFEWDEFRDHLIREVSRWEAQSAPEEEYHYYELFCRALENLLVEKEICSKGELLMRTSEMEQRPAGHDHS